MRMLYIVTKGTDDATLASVPLHIAANGSLEVGQEVSVVLAGDGTDLVIGEYVVVYAGQALDRMATDEAEAMLQFYAELEKMLEEASP